MSNRGQIHILRIRLLSSIYYHRVSIYIYTQRDDVGYGLGSLGRSVHNKACFLLTDSEQKKWRLGKIIGQGGCGLIYLASRDVDRPVAADTDFVIKLEYHENGPLFSELKFYQRAAKAESMQKWKTRRKLDFLGIPTYWGSGLAEYKDLRYRFMAMDRLGSDLQKILEHSGGQLKKATVLQLGRRLVDILEYIHENEYVHADIKAANLMLGCRDPEQVYLADYGLSYRYSSSRRGDLQILGFSLLHWLCGSLPWEKLLRNPTQVQEAKARLMDNLPDSVLQLSVRGASTGEEGEAKLQAPQRSAGQCPHGGAGLLCATRTRRGKAGRVKRPPKAEAVPAEKEVEDVPAVSRSLRPRGAVTYMEDNSESEEEEEDDDEDEEEEEEASPRPRPIAACYLRGPPTSSGAQSKQKYTGRKTDGFSAMERKKRQLLSHRRKHCEAQGGDGREGGPPMSGWAALKLQEKDRYPPQIQGYEHTHNSEQEAPLTRRNGWFSMFFFAGVFFFLGAALGVCQCEFKPF
ncbi:hypothetical protein F7725_024388 [Dissostichus mawsoni]|uniref:non-specific serine/threonine protein kinase n=1 Tax=Dissostichus mawsoni TaxID=36200 RepID=A0A7J5Y186_DISMA|nr:hypothetical protein F7725_024388 [Dissostichus mawsoni]